METDIKQGTIIIDPKDVMDRLRNNENSLEESNVSKVLLGEYDADRGMYLLDPTDSLYAASESFHLGLTDLFDLRINPYGHLITGMHTPSDVLRMREKGKAFPHGTIWALEVTRGKKNLVLNVPVFYGKKKSFLWTGYGWEIDTPTEQEMKQRKAILKYG